MFAEKAHVALDRPDQAAECAHQRGLAGAVGAKHSDQFALGDFEIGIADDGCRAIAGGKSAHGQQRRLLRRKRTRAGAVGVLTGAEIGFTHCRIGGDLSGCAFGDLGAGIEHDDVVGHAHHQIHVVLDQDHGHAGGGKLAQQSADRRAVLRVQAGRRLVERKHARADRERAGDFDQPFVDMRQRGRRPFERTGVADKGEQAFGDLGARRHRVCRRRKTRRQACRACSAIRTLSRTDMVSNNWLV